MSGIDITIVRPPAAPDTVAIPGWNTPVGESPDVLAERERRNKEAARRATQNYEQWQKKHEAWLAEQEQRRSDAKASNDAAVIERYKEQRRRDFLKAPGLTASDFEREWPRLLKDWQLSVAESGGLEIANLRSSGKYEM